MWSNAAIAEDVGKFTFLGLNQCAPFEGVLFDPPATARILAQAQTATDNCDARLTYELGKQAADHELDLQNLTIRHESLIAEYDMRVASLEREADALAKALKKQSAKNPALWIVAGVASGMAISYGAYKVFNE
tara:strand:+ start:72 stop:470 length:399 start_codon:yes stop_codon:yes gene_type:complete